MRPLAIVALLFASATAHGYVRTRTPDGVPIRWPASCVTVSADDRGSTDLPVDAVFADLRRALVNWQSATLACSYLQLNYGAPTERDVPMNDGVNLVQFHSASWSHNGDPTNLPYDPSAQGITTVFFNDHPGQPDDGVILDADIELNAVSFTFVDVAADGSTATAARSSTTAADLENTLTHELGHLQGLSHNCGLLPGMPETEVDEDGNPPPDCDSPNLDPKITSATMYPYAAPLSTQERTPEADDIAGICADNAYPLANDPHQCESIALAAPTTLHFSGCAITARDDVPRGMWLALGWILCVLALRRRSTGRER
jgi:hypothetical protein